MDYQVVLNNNFLPWREIFKFCKNWLCLNDLVHLRWLDGRNTFSAFVIHSKFIEGPETFVLFICEKPFDNKSAAQDWIFNTPESLVNFGASETLISISFCVWLNLLWI